MTDATTGRAPAAATNTAATNTAATAAALPRLGIALGTGALFGFGLALSTMVRPDVVLSFLRFQDFGLALVLGAGVLVTFLAYRFAPRLLQRPLLGGTFREHEATMSRATIAGAAIFGVGWGFTGVCPGPAIAGLGAGSYELLFSIAGLALGALLQGLTSRGPR